MVPKFTESTLATLDHTLGSRNNFVSVGCHGTTGRQARLGLVKLSENCWTTAYSALRLLTRRGHVMTYVRFVLVTLAHISCRSIADSQSACINSRYNPVTHRAYQPDELPQGAQPAPEGYEGG